MSVDILENRSKPCRAVFKLVAVEDLPESLKMGRFVAKNVEMIELHPDAKTVVEKAVDDTHRNAYRAQYDAWKVGLDTPVSGVPLRTWAAMAPDAIMTLLNYGIMTVENLSEIDDEKCTVIGPQAKGWREKAKLWLNASLDTTKAATQMLTLNNKVKELQDKVKEQEETITRLREKYKKP